MSKASKSKSKKSQTKLTTSQQNFLAFFKQNQSFKSSHSGIRPGSTKVVMPKFGKRGDR